MTQLIAVRCWYIMVNKFGDDTLYPSHGSSGTINAAILVIKKIVITQGKFSDYCNQIISTCKLGFTPYRITSQGAALPVFTYNGRVYSQGSVCCDDVADRAFQHVTSVYHHIGQLCATETITDRAVTKDNSLVIFKRVDDDESGGYVIALQ